VPTEGRGLRKFSRASRALAGDEAIDTQGTATIKLAGDGLADMRPERPPSGFAAPARAADLGCARRTRSRRRLSAARSAATSWPATS
jgi:hypothetical protein